MSLKSTMENDSLTFVQWFRNNHMDANTSKFQGVIMSRRGSVSLELSIHDNTIHTSNHIKILDITLDDKLNFNTHVNNICTRAAWQVNALKIISKCLNEESRLLIYKTFIVANFSYCPVVWMFCGKQNSLN